MDAAAQQQYRVRVWFGAHPIADYRAGKALADRYAAAMGRRFAGLRITIHQIPPPTSPTAPAAAPDPDLPTDDRLFALTAFGGGGQHH